MRPGYITHEFLNRFIGGALREDIGDGDHSTLASIPEKTTSRARLVVKEEGVLAGIELAEHIFKIFDPALQTLAHCNDGDLVKKGEVVLTVKGAARSILTTERLVLNCMQRMSGIATKTRHLANLIAGTKAQLLDTRKTTPNFRLLEKWAVIIGGGRNHRLGLYDMVMLKDNHTDMAGGIEQAIIRTKDYLRATNRVLRVEIETRSIEEVREVLRVGEVDIILLDNMEPETLRECVTIIDGRFKTEASGNVTEETIRGMAESGVDFISVGGLTHSVKSLDMSLKAF